MGVGVGYAHSFKISDLKDTVGKEQLHVPLGVALQWLPGSTKAPGKFGIGFHAMGTALDLGNYVYSTNASTTKVDWKAIVAPGIQAGVAIGKPNNFFVVGAMFSYSPQFVNTTINNTTTPYSATKYGLFVHYYFSLWDLN
jgi:hypothetical protein